MTLTGHHLDGTNVSVAFTHPLWTAPVEIQVPAGPDATATQVVVTIPTLPATWPAGMYSVQVFVQRPGDTFRRSSNQLPSSLAPSFTIVPVSAAAGAITYTATVSPEVRPQQRVGLLLGSQEILADAHAVQTNTLTFRAVGVTPGDYFVRLRVDGVDSVLVDKSVKPPIFDATQRVTVT